MPAQGRRSEVQVEADDIFPLFAYFQERLVVSSLLAGAFAASVSYLYCAEGYILAQDEKIPDWLWCLLDFQDHARHVTLRKNELEKTEFEIMLEQPATITLMALNAAFFLYLRAHEIAPELVAVSFADIVERRQYWRWLTSALSHYSLWHFGMNMASLYNLGQELETRIGSLSFFIRSFVALLAAESLALVILRITKYRHNTRRLGFSGILFSWIVAAATRTPSYCLFPGVCFETRRFFWDLPINFALFVLALLIQLIVPQASFLGHCTGALVGFPLAWGYLDRLTPVYIIAAITLIDHFLHPSIPQFTLSSSFQLFIALLLFFYGFWPNAALTAIAALLPKPIHALNFFLCIDYAGLAGILILYSPQRAAVSIFAALAHSLSTCTLFSFYATSLSRCWTSCYTVFISRFGSTRSHSHGAFPGHGHLLSRTKTEHAFPSSSSSEKKKKKIIEEGGFLHNKVLPPSDHTTRAQNPQQQQEQQQRQEEVQNNQKSKKEPRDYFTV